MTLYGFLDDYSNKYDTVITIYADGKSYRYNLPVDLFSNLPIDLFTREIETVSFDDFEETIIVLSGKSTVAVSGLISSSEEKTFENIVLLFGKAMSDLTLSDLQAISVICDDYDVPHTAMEHYRTSGLFFCSDVRSLTAYELANSLMNTLYDLTLHLSDGRTIDGSPDNVLAGLLWSPKYLTERCISISVSGDMITAEFESSHVDVAPVFLGCGW